MKLIIADKRMPDEAKSALSRMGEVFWFDTSGITYPAISRHPDIFVAQAEEKLVIAPNTPSGIVKILNQKKISFETGTLDVGPEYPLTARYNACIDENVFIHNMKISDNSLRKYSENRLCLDVAQGYCRCNCISLNGRSYICSDRSVEKALLNAGKKVLYIAPESVLLEGFSHGFIGGTAGVTGDIIVFCGSLKNLDEGEKVQNFILQTGIRIIELYSGPLIDVGSILIAG